MRKLHLWHTYFRQDVCSLFFPAISVSLYNLTPSLLAVVSYFLRDVRTQDIQRLAGQEIKKFFFIYFYTRAKKSLEKYCMLLSFNFCFLEMPNDDLTITVRSLNKYVQTLSTIDLIKRLYIKYFRAIPAKLTQVKFTLLCLLEIRMTFVLCEKPDAWLKIREHSWKWSMDYLGCFLLNISVWELMFCQNVCVFFLIFWVTCCTT